MYRNINNAKLNLKTVRLYQAAIDKNLDESYVKSLKSSGRFWLILDTLINGGLYQYMSLGYFYEDMMTIFLSECDDLINDSHDISGKEAIQVYLYCLKYPAVKNNWFHYAESNSIPTGEWPFDNDFTRLRAVIDQSHIENLLKDGRFWKIADAIDSQGILNYYMGDYLNTNCPKCFRSGRISMNDFLMVAVYLCLYPDIKDSRSWGPKDA